MVFKHKHRHIFGGGAGPCVPHGKPSVWLSPAPQAKPVTGQTYKHILEPCLLGLATYIYPQTFKAEYSFFQNKIFFPNFFLSI